MDSVKTLTQRGLYLMLLGLEKNKKLRILVL